MSAAQGVVMTIVCTEPDGLRFCRKMSAVVNPSSLYLSRVMVTGRQIYPFHDAVLGSADVMLRCEFRLRDANAIIARRHVDDLLERLRHLEVIDAHTVDGAGSTIERVGLPVTIGS